MESASSSSSITDSNNFLSLSHALSLSDDSTYPITESTSTKTTDLSNAVVRSGLCTDTTNDPQQACNDALIDKPCRKICPRVASSAPIRCHVLYPPSSSSSTSSEGADTTMTTTSTPSLSSLSVPIDSPLVHTSNKDLASLCTCGRQHLMYGETYLYCTCGKGQEQPFCDRKACQGSVFQPLTFTVTKRQTYYLLCPW